MPPILRLAAPLLLLVIASASAYRQISDPYKVKNSSTPCLRIRPQPTTGSACLSISIEPPPWSAATLRLTVYDPSWVKATGR